MKLFVELLEYLNTIKSTINYKLQSTIKKGFCGRFLSTQADKYLTHHLTPITMTASISTKNRGKYVILPSGIWIICISSN